VDGGFPWTSQTRTIPIGKTVGLAVTCDGASDLYFVTPRIVPRTQ